MTQTFMPPAGITSASALYAWYELLHDRPAIIDFETRSTNPHFTDTGALEPWAAGFEVASLAVAASVSHSWFYTEPTAIRQALEFLANNQIPVWAYNIAYEMQVMAAVFPDIRLNWAGDVQRLVLVYDNGGNIPEKRKFEDDEDDPDAEVPEFYFGLGLKKAGPRILGMGTDTDSDTERLLRYAPVEQEAYAWIRDNLGVRKGREGPHLAALPLPLLERYNRADVENTFRLYNKTTAAFAALSYDWRIDMALFMNSVRLIVGAKMRGVPVDRAALAAYKAQVEAEIHEVETAFRTEFGDAIAAVEQVMHDDAKALRKTDKGRERVPRPVFNIGSNDQLARLFVGSLGLSPAFVTDSGKPSFKRAHLPTWGTGGSILATRRARQIVGSQCGTLLFKSGFDGRWHLDLKANGTRSGRFAGAGGLNVQGLARRDRGLMGTILAEHGCSIASIDMSAGEPTVTTHYSKDAMYYNCTFGMVGKAPYFAAGQLCIDDLYLSVMSVSPVGRADLLAAWDRKYDGLTFAEQWVKDPDPIKKSVKKQRDFHKMIALAIAYGLGPKGMERQSREHGRPMDARTCRAFYQAYWDLFPDVRAFAKNCESYLKKHGAIVNPFGYRLTCPPHLGFNQYIQSSVSGIMHLYCRYLMEEAPWARFLTVIHDEVLVEFCDSRLDEFRIAKETATQRLNENLRWSVAVRTGLAVGKTWFEAK